MPIALVPCSACQRHIRIDHGACPFCSAAVPADIAQRVIPGARTRLDRLATFTFAASLTIGAACGGSDDGSTTGSKSDAGGAADSGSVKDDGGGQAIYGAPIDASPGKDGGGPKDDGGVAALYGAAFDAGGSPETGVQPPYGLPPMDAGND